MQACPYEQQVDVALLFGPSLLFPKQLFGVTVMLPPLPPAAVRAKKEPSTTPAPAPLQPKVQEPSRPSRDKLATVERRLLAFLVEHDTDPATEADLSLDTSDTLHEPLGLSHPSCDKIKKRAMKCHVALRAQRKFLHAGITAAQSGDRADRAPTWVLKPSFHPRGLDQLFVPPGDASEAAGHSHSHIPPRSGTASQRPQGTGGLLNRATGLLERPSAQPAGNPFPSSVPPCPLASNVARTFTPPPCRQMTPETSSSSLSLPRGRSVSNSSSPVSGSISWSGVVAGAEGAAGAQTQARVSLPSQEVATSSTPLRAPRSPAMQDVPRHVSILPVGSSPSSMLSTNSDGSGTRAHSTLRGAKSGPLCGRMRLDLCHMPDRRSTVPIYQDSDEEDLPETGKGVATDTSACAMTEPEPREWAVFAPPIMGGGVGL